MPHLACLLRRLGDVDVHVRRSGLTVLERLATAALLSGEQRAAVALPLPDPFRCFFCPFRFGIFDEPFPPPPPFAAPCCEPSEVEPPPSASPKRSFLNMAYFEHPMRPCECSCAAGEPKYASCCKRRSAVLAMPAQEFLRLGAAL